MNVNKPRTWTSHDVVARVRRLSSQKRVGHAGTLDPMAEGVLPVLLGRATRLADFVQHTTKTYRGVVSLGTATETDDAEGKVIASRAVPPLNSRVLAEAIAGFVGQTLQVPPRYSALKIDGRRAYAVARGGGDVELSARNVTIYAIELLEWSPSHLGIEVTCAGGTYIRALARDIGLALGTVAHLGGLVRTRVGSFCLADSLTLDDIAQRGVSNMLLPADHALPDAPVFHADQPQTLKLANGQAVASVGLYAERVWVYDPEGQLVCLASADGAVLQPRIAL